MNEEFSFDVDENFINEFKKTIGDEIEARHKRFKEGKETIDDLINGIHHYKIKIDNGLDLDVVELKYYNKIIDLYNKEKEKYKQLFEEYNKRVATIIKYEQEIKDFLDNTNITDIEPWSEYKIKGELLFNLEKSLEE